MTDEIAIGAPLYKAVLTDKDGTPHDVAVGLATGDLAMPDGADVAEGTTTDATSANQWDQASASTVLQVLASAARVLGQKGDAAVNDTTLPATIAARLTSAVHFLAILFDLVNGGMPLPANAAAETGGNLDAINSELSSIEGSLASLVAQGSPVQSTPLAHASASKASRVSADIPVTGRGLLLTVTLANKANFPTFTPMIEGKSASGAYHTLWTASAALSGNGVAAYQIGQFAATAVAGGITEGKIALIPGVVRLSLVYAGNGTTDAFDTTLDLDVTP